MCQLHFRDGGINYCLQLACKRFIWNFKNIFNIEIHCLLINRNTYHLCKTINIEMILSRYLCCSGHSALMRVITLSLWWIQWIRMVRSVFFLHYKVNKVEELNELHVVGFSYIYDFFAGLSVRCVIQAITGKQGQNWPFYFCHSHIFHVFSMLLTYTSEHDSYLLS